MSQEIKNKFRVTFTDGSQEDFHVGGVRIRDGVLELCTVYWSVMSTSETPVIWFAPGSWKMVERV
jgi:hypothetical protein